MNRSSSMHFPWRCCRTNIGHVLLALAVVSAWGSNFVVIRYALDGLPPFTLATIRFICDFVPACFFVPTPGKSIIGAAIYGVLIGFGQSGLLISALNGYISPGLASLVLQAQVFFTIGLSAWLSGDSITPGQIIGALLRTMSLGLIFTYSDDMTTPWGVFLVIGAALSWAVGNCVAKARAAGDMLSFVVWGSLFSVPALALTALLFEGAANIIARVSGASLEIWLPVFWRAWANTIFGYSARSWLISLHSVAVITATGLLIPAFGILFSALVYAEDIPLWKWAVIFLIMAGLVTSVALPLLS